MPSIVEIRNLKKQYAPTQGQKEGQLAVKGISLSIEKGEIFSLLGPNGAGKTTTISIMSGLLPPTSGDVMIGGHSIVSEPMAVKKLIGNGEYLKILKKWGVESGAITAADVKIDPSGS